MSTLVDSSGAAIVVEKKKPKILRSERRRMLRDPDYQNKVISGTEGVPPYYRLLAYGQVLISEMTQIQQRMAGIEFARERRKREEYSIELTEKWNDLVEKLGGVQEEMKQFEILEEIKQLPHREVEIYGLC